MKEVITTTAISAGTGFFGWLFAKLQTRSERKKTDLQLINEAITPLLCSIKDLTEQNNDMVNRLLAEQDKNLQLIAEKSEWIKERGTLMEKIEELERQIKTLNKKINGFIKHNETNS